MSSGSVPGAPPQVSAAGAGKGAIRVRWIPVSGALSYTVHRGMTSDGAFEAAGTALDSSWLDTGLVVGERYYYRVKALNESGASEFSPTASAAAGDALGGYGSLVSRVETALAEQRGLQFTRTLTVSTLSRDEYALRVAGYMQGSVSSEEDTLLTREFVQLGFMTEAEGSFSQTTQEYQTQFAGAFYVPGTDSVYIITSPDLSNDDLEYYYLPHEFTHALQDQQFHAFSALDWPRTGYSHFNSDFYIAQQSVTEGDAVFTQTVYAYDNYYRSFAPYTDANNKLADWREEYLDSLSVGDRPRYLDVRGMSYYLLGGAYVSGRYLGGGWQAVNDLYVAHVPQTAAEIITSQSITPHRFAFDGMYNLLLTGAASVRYADDDNYGPVMLLGLLCDHIDVTHASQALGYRGDRCLYVTINGEKYGRLVWAFSLATESDARYLMSALDGVLSQRRLDSTLATRTTSTDTVKFIHPAGGLTARLVRDGAGVYWVENVPDSLCPSVFAELHAPSPLAKRNATPSAVFLTQEKKRKVIDGLLGKCARNYRRLR